MSEKRAYPVSSIVMNLLFGVLKEGLITDDEYQLLLDKLSGMTVLSEDNINSAVVGIGNGELIASRLRKQLLQQNIGPAPAAQSVVPAQTVAISANDEVSENNVSSQTPTITGLSDKLAQLAINKVISDMRSNRSK